MTTTNLNKTISMISNEEQPHCIDERIDENPESISLIWFDQNISSHEDIQIIIKRLNEINNYVRFDTQLNQCLQRIQSIKNEEQILLIISDVQAKELLSSIIDLDQINSIFIFSLNKVEYEHWKIVGFYDNLESLFVSVDERVKFVEKQLGKMNLFDELQPLSKQSAEFLWFQMLNKVIDHFPRREHSKKEMVDLCRSYYRTNPKELEFINDFEHNYRSDLAIQWYLKQSFLSRIFQKALRNENIHLLNYFRFFINDLSINLSRHEHQQIIQSNENIFHVYREMKLSFKQFEQYKDNQGKLLSFNGYLLTNRHRDQGRLAFTTKSPEIVSVLFEIKCDREQLGNKIHFSDVNHSNAKGEVLFDLNCSFRLESIEQDDGNDQQWLIKMNATIDGQTITHNYIEMNRRESEMILFGRLMYQTNHYQESRRYFEQLLVYSNGGGEDICWLEYHLAYIAQCQNELKRARELYDQAYDRMIHSNPSRIQDSAFILNNIGQILERQGKYDESYQFYQRALKIRETYCSIDHLDIAQILQNIGCLLDKRQKYDQALYFFQRTLTIQEKSSSINHPDIACTLNLIGKVLFKQGKNKDALKFFQRALQIQDEYYFNDHLDKNETLNNIAMTYEKLNIPRMAIVYYQRLLIIQKKYLSNQNQSQIKTQMNIHRLSSSRH